MERTGFKKIVYLLVIVSLGTGCATLQPVEKFSPNWTQEQRIRIYEYKKVDVGWSINVGKQSLLFRPQWFKLDNYYEKTGANEAAAVQRKWQGWQWAALPLEIAGAIMLGSQISKKNPNSGDWAVAGGLLGAGLAIELSTYLLYMKTASTKFNMFLKTKLGL